MRAENPHAGASGVPFMKRMTWFSAMASAIASRRGFSVAARTWWGSYGVWVFTLTARGWTADLAAEDVIDELVLLDAAQARERGDTTVARKWSPPPVQSSTSAWRPGSRPRSAA